MILCSDIDLLHWEPNLFRDAAFASQTLLSGGGTLDGAHFTLAAGSLADSHIQAGHIIYVNGAVCGSFPIVSIDSPTELTLSVLYDGLFADPAQPAAPAPPGSPANLTFAIRTFWPHRRIASDVIRRAAGIENQGESAVLNLPALVRPAALGSLQLIYSALAAAAAEPQPLAARADLYQQLYRRALRQSRVEIDSNGDGRADIIRHIGMIQFQRE